VQKCPSIHISLKEIDLHQCFQVGGIGTNHNLSDSLGYQYLTTAISCTTFSAGSFPEHTKVNFVAF